MPIEIRELIISAKVDTSGRHRKKLLKGKNSSRKDRATSIEDTVDEVMRLLKKKKER